MKKAKRILANNREFVENLVKALIEKKFLSFNEIQEIKKNSHVVCN